MAALKTLVSYSKSILISRNFFQNDSGVYNLAVFFRYTFFLFIRTQFIRTAKQDRMRTFLRLPQPPSTGLLLICMIEKHTSIFRALQGNQGVAATQPSPKRGKKRIKINSYQFLLGQGGVAGTSSCASNVTKTWFWSPVMY